ncbi:hypothetical protein EN898_31900, partial [Mesorhizobium sp. M7A.F.Ca.CA.001.06.1.1]
GHALVVRDGLVEAILPTGAVENPGASQGKAIAHTVSVTLRRLRGVSGSRPRWRANASTNM